MIDEGRSGFLVDAEDVNALANRISLLLEDDTLRNRMGSAARATAERRFHPHAIAQKTMAVYQRILG